MITFNEYCKRVFGEKLYKISLNGGFTCPNRDGSKGTGGCIFCSAGGSGDFAPDACLKVDEQIEQAKLRVAGKYSGSRYIAYFQAFTNTYASAEHLRRLYIPVIRRDDIAALSIATRPDCLGGDILEVIRELASVKPVFVELGLQTIHDRTVEYIRRHYELSEYDRAVSELKKLHVHVVTHVILGLPGETKEDMVQTVRYVADAGSDGIKLQLLHVLEGTDLAADYRAGRFNVLSLDEYIDILKACCAELPDNMVVHRLTGDGPKKILVAPLWSADKKNVLNRINREVLKNCSF